MISEKKHLYDENSGVVNDSSIDEPINSCCKFDVLGKGDLPDG